jgi:protoporphyrinogen oxidase
MTDKNRDIVVLGGGLTGLTAGMFTGAPVYEAADHVGGAAASDRVDGYTFDRGIHVLQTRSQQVLDLLDKVGVELNIHDRSAHIYAFNRYTAYPFQINSTNLPIGRRIKCVWDFLNRDRNPEPTNYEGWIRKNIGQGFATTFLIPYSEKFWGVHPREMTFEWTGNRVPKANAWQVLRGAVISRNTRVGSNAVFRYPKGAGGYGAVAEALARHVGELHLGHRATHVDLAGRRVTFNDSIEVPYKVLVTSVPIPELIRIASDVPNEVREAVASLRTNSILVVNLGVGRANLSRKHWVHFPDKDISFFRISFPHNFSAELTPPGMSSVSAEVAYTLDAPPDEEATVQRVIDDLVGVGVLRRDDPIVAVGTRHIKYAYCIYDEPRQKALPVLRNWLKRVDVVPGGRFGLWTYFWSDEAILSGKKSAQQAEKQLARVLAREGGPHAADASSAAAGRQRHARSIAPLPPQARPSSVGSA